MANLQCDFQPQAWINDYAVDVDPKGETRFVVSDAEARRLTGFEGDWGDFDSDSHEGDELRRASTAPAWVLNWNGPFRIDIEETEAAAPVLVAATFERWIYATCRRAVPADASIEGLPALAGDIKDHEWRYEPAVSGAPVLAELYDSVADQMLYDADAPLPEIATRLLRQKLDAAMARCVEAPSDEARLIFEVLGGVKQALDGDDRVLDAMPWVDAPND